MSKGESTVANRSPPATEVLTKGRPGYGIDEHRTILELAIAGILAILIGFLISAYTRTSQPDLSRLGLLVGPAVGFLILAVTAALYWSSASGKVREMEKVITRMPWGGNEIVLDLGCGRGLAMVMAAKRLESGCAVGVDIWRRSHLSGNSHLSIWANAKKEGVEGKVSAVKGLPSSLPFLDRSFDAVLSGVAIHRVAAGEREALFDEVVRILKDGGRVGILDAGNGLEYAKHLRRVGMSDVEVHRLRLSSFPPFHVVMGRKPYSG